MHPLRDRCLQPEEMDQPGIAPDRHRHALDGLARINWFSRTAGILWPHLRDLARELAPRPLRLLDMATGAGDVPVRLALRARRHGLTYQITAWDRSEQALGFARDRARRAGVEIEFTARDACTGPPLTGFDAVTCTLFLHHLDEERAVSLLRRLAGLDEQGRPTAASPRLVLINDLERSALGLLLVRIGTRLLSLSPVVHGDGIRSARAAFTRAEAAAMAQRAGLTGARVTGCWPLRWLLTWRGP